MMFAGFLRRPSRLLAVSAILVPVLLFFVTAWLDYISLRARAEEYVVTTANALAEQMQEALLTASLILARTLDRVEGMDWQTIGSSRQVHDFLAKIANDTPLVQSVFLVDPDGYNSASSRIFPMQPFDVRNREYYVQAIQGNDDIHITPTFVGKMTGEPGFTVSRARLKDGHFDRVVAVTLSPAYFESFYRKIAISPEHASASLVRTDGRLVVRYPKTDSGVVAVPATSPLLKSAAGAESGVFSGRSSVDGIAKLVAFRRVDNQPLLANFALAHSYYLNQWYIHLIWMGIFALLTAAALAWTSAIVLRRTETEATHLRRLLAESERRKQAEQRVQHLQKMEALGRLSGGVAHDFNNLLTAILGALELASARLDEPARVARLLATATNAAQRGARLTSQMLAFSRDTDITPTPLDINGTIEESDGLIRRMVEPLVDISYSLGDSLWPAIADRTQFEVALLNLAANARDAMPLGGKLVFVTRNVSLAEDDPVGLPAGDYVQISVTDTGEGMSADTLAHAFDPFFTTKPIGKGTGLGLSQVHGFATQLGGAVTIDSAPGQGTTVTVRLPRAHAAVAPRAETEPAGAVSVASLRILAVDDDEAVRTLVAEMLTDLGHSVTTAENGPEAVALLAGGAEVDLLLLDFAMPLANGAQVAEEALKQRLNLPILFITGYADANALSSWADLGYPTLNKPFSARDLDRAIRQAVNARAQKIVRLPRRRREG